MTISQYWEKPIHRDRAAISNHMDESTILGKFALTTVQVALDFARVISCCGTVFPQIALSSIQYVALPLRAMKCSQNAMCSAIVNGQFLKIVIILLL